MGANNEKNFKIIRKLGEGGFGEVYLIEKDNKLYALKKTKHALSQEEINKYNKIINALKNINNPFVTKYYYTYTEKNSFNIVMEFCGEKNLKQFIADYRNKNEFIEEKIISFIITQICLGLKEIHKNQLIHRDLTPDNIFIDENNSIKIGDFGISKIIATNKYTQSRIGKYQYFAPEIEMGEKYNNKIDIYSLGYIMYELFTQNEYYIDKRIREKDCQINSEVYNPEWQKVIDLLLNKDYHKRPDIEEVYRLIHHINTNLSFNFKFEYCLRCKELYCKNCFEILKVHKCESVLKKSLKRINKDEYKDLLNKKIPSISLRSKLFFIS